MIVLIHAAENCHKYNWITNKNTPKCGLVQVCKTVHHHVGEISHANKNQQGHAFLQLRAWILSEPHSHLDNILHKYIIRLPCGRVSNKIMSVINVKLTQNSLDPGLVRCSALYIYMSVRGSACKYAMTQTSVGALQL